MSADIDILLQKALVSYRVEVERNVLGRETEKQLLMEEIRPALPEDVREYLHLAPRIDGGWFFFLYIPGCSPIQLQFRRQIGDMELHSAVVLDENARNVWSSKRLLLAIGKARDLVLKNEESERAY